MSRKNIHDRNRIGSAIDDEQRMSDATNYHRYQWDLFSRLLGKRIVEIGPGFGQYTRQIIDSGRAVFACDLDQRHLHDLHQTISSDALQSRQLDLQNPGPAEHALRDFHGDTAVLLNVLEHIENDVAALAFLRSVVTERGRLILLVPSHQWLYNGLDQQAGHFRRYTRSSLSKTVTKAGWRPVISRYVNAPGIPGWLVAGIMSRVLSPKEQLDAGSTNALVRLYDRWFTGLSRATDPLFSRLCGLSVFLYCEAN
jgi:SAM-dependent methyltransferase